MERAGTAPPGHRGEAFTAWEAVACAALGVAFTALIGGGVAWPAVSHGGLLNPDSYMRLVRLREMVAAGAPLDGVARDGSGQGMVLPWSHLLDSLVVLLAAPFAPWLGWDEAARRVAVGFGPLCMGALAAAVAWAVSPLAERRWRLVAPVMLVVSPPLVAYGLPGVLHHHVLLAVCAVMVAGWAGRAAAGGPGGAREGAREGAGQGADARAGLRAGAWGAVGLWFSPETAPFTLAAFAALGLSWLAGPGRAHAAAGLRGAGTAFLAVLAAAYAVDPPLDRPFDPALDRLSTVWLALGAACCASGWLAWLASRWAPGPGPVPGRARLAGAAMAVLPPLVWLCAFPRVLLGPDALMTPEQARAFFDVIGEMQPVAGWGEAARDLAPGALAAGLTAWWAAHRRSVPWAWAALCAAAAVGLGALHLRFAAYPAAFAAAALPVVLTRCPGSEGRRLGRDGGSAPPGQSVSGGTRTTEMEDAPERGGISGAVVFRPSAGVFIPAGPFARPALLLAFVAGPLLGADAARASDAGAPPARCTAPPPVALLDPAAGEVVLTGPNEAPELLYRTGVLTVGSLYHRGIESYMRLRAAWRSGPADEQPDAVRATGARWVLACRGAARDLLVSDLPPDTLRDRLARGEAPPWLSLAGSDEAGWMLWRVVGAERR